MPATRIFDILTTWLRMNQGSSCVTAISAGKIKITLLTANDTKTFYGETVQDAYAQATQTILLEATE